MSDFMEPRCGMCERALYGDHAEHRLCRGCTRATGERLNRMPALHRALAAFLPPASRRPESGHTRPAEPPLPVRENVLDLRGPGGIVGILEDWRAAMHRDLAWSEPVTEGSIENRIQAAVNGLSANMLWIAGEWPEAGQLAHELRDLETAALSIADPPEHTIRLGNCIALHDDGSQCGAILRVSPGVADVHCPWCRASWPPDTWLTLAAQQPQGEAA